MKVPKRRLFWTTFLYWTLFSSALSDGSAYKTALDKWTEALRLRSSPRRIEPFVMNDKARILRTLNLEEFIVSPDPAILQEVTSVLRDSGYGESYDDQLCSNHSIMIFEGLAFKQRWAQQMIDAAAKPPTDLLNGNLNWHGSFDECRKVKATYRKDNISAPVHLFDGKYCTAVFSGGAYGFCVPSTCSESHTSKTLNDLLALLPGNLTVKTMMCEGNIEVDSVFTAAVVIIGCLVLLALCGTVYDLLHNVLFRCPKETIPNPSLEPSIDEKTHLIGEVKTTRQHSPGVLGKLLLSFSLYTNGKKLLNTKQTTGSLTAINGMRFVSITWVILGHTFAFISNYASNFYPWLMDMLHRYTFQVITNALVCVDSFFAMSGLLLGYLTLKELEKRDGKLNFAMFYFHRFWRLTPPYMLILLVDVGLMRYFGNGPYWPKEGFEQNQCKDTWYYNLLYVNNFLKDDQQECMGWSWYLANDMQFFVLSPLILLPLYHYEMIGWLVCVVFILGTWVTTGVLSAHYDLPPSLFGGGGSPSGLIVYFNRYYIKPYCRMGPYVIGILAGYILFKSRCRVRINKYLNILIWAVATVLAVIILYGLRDPIVDTPLSTPVIALFNATHRTVWGACVCWVIFACATGNGGFVNTLLSWPGFAPLSRLSYCVYLIHPLIMFLYYGSLRNSIYLTDLTGIYLLFGNLLGAFLAAFVASLLFEAPMLGLEKVILRRDGK